MWVGVRPPRRPIRLAAPAPVKGEQDSQTHAPPRVELAVASKGSGLFLPIQAHGNVRAESWGGHRGARGPPHWNVSALSPPVRRATTRPHPNQERCGRWWEGGLRDMRWVSRPPPGTSRCPVHGSPSLRLAAQPEREAWAHWHFRSCRMPGRGPRAGTHHSPQPIAC